MSADLLELTVWALPGAVLALSCWVERLRLRVQRLERRLDALEEARR